MVGANFGADVVGYYESVDGTGVGGVAEPPGGGGALSYSYSYDGDGSSSGAAWIQLEITDDAARAPGGVRFEAHGDDAPRLQVLKVAAGLLADFDAEDLGELAAADADRLLRAALELGRAFLATEAHRPPRGGVPGRLLAGLCGCAVHNDLAAKLRAPLLDAEATDDAAVASRLGALLEHGRGGSVVDDALAARLRAFARDLGDVSDRSHHVARCAAANAVSCLCRLAGRHISGHHSTHAFHGRRHHDAAGHDATCPAHHSRDAHCDDDHHLAHPCAAATATHGHKAKLWDAAADAFQRLKEIRRMSTGLSTHAIKREAS